MYFKILTQKQIRLQREVVEVRVEALVVLGAKGPLLVVHQVAVDHVVAEEEAHGHVCLGPIL